ncbi:MAG: diaminopimelate dehydrogenase [Tissierellia bacterium]|nr:diaminopimelate dehydrogenase [Tissierellia bacterium]
MTNKIRIGIVGYGNLGRGVELALEQNEDFILEAIFTRRNPSNIDTDSYVVHIDEVLDYRNEIDVMILCGGSASDLPEQCPQIAANFNTVDSFDNHGKIPEYFNTIDRIAKESDTVSLFSIGWDPGLFSLNRLMAQCILPAGKTYTFWGKGVSQGHSDAIRRIDGVRDAIQYTIPLEEAIEDIRAGNNPDLQAEERHRRVCYVVPYDSKDMERIEEEIKSMPGYFLGYDTTVHFITQEELIDDHSNMFHGGFVIHTGRTAEEHNHRIEYGLTLDHNPQFTSSVLVAFARAAHRLSLEGQRGAFSIFDIPLAYLSPKSGDELRKTIL